MSRAVIFANGLVKNIELVRTLLQQGDLLIAADGGTKYVLQLGLIPSIIIGDLDSLNSQDQAAVIAGGCKIIQHPQNKNETDFELVLRYAVEAGYTEIMVVGALGGRLDQTLGNLFVLTSPDFANFNVSMDDGVETARFTRRYLEVQGDPGDIVSLIPWGGEVIGITTIGLHWPLENESLFADKTRGISNELLGTKGSVSIKSGLLLVIRRRNQNPSI